jgi:hypothetical protein
MNSSAEIKKTVTILLSAKSPLMTPAVVEALRQAKSHAETLPPVEVPTMLIPVLPPPKELGKPLPLEVCPSTRPVWTSGVIPKVVQDAVPLAKGIQSSDLAVRVVPSVSTRVTPRAIDVAESRVRRAKGTGLQTKVVVGTSYRTNLLVASRLADAFRQPTPLREVDPAASAGALRDIAQGFVFEELATIQTSAEKRTRLEKLRTTDISLYVLQANYSEQKREANKLRASERLTLVAKMAGKNDAEREIVGALLKIGLAPYIITNQDRALFARQAERLQDLVAVEDAEADVGVGRAREELEDGEPRVDGVGDQGDYGDRAALPEGRAYAQPGLGDDAERSI